MKQICKEQRKEVPYGPEPLLTHDYQEHPNIDHSLHNPGLQIPLDPYHHLPTLNNFGQYNRGLNRIKRDTNTKELSGYRNPPKLSSSREVPPHPECQPIATKSCHQIPIVVPKKVPYETCHSVPTLDCSGLVLKTVPKVECLPQTMEECKNEAKEVPYIVTEEQCDKVTYEECQEVRNTIRVDESSLV